MMCVPARRFPLLWCSLIRVYLHFRLLLLRVYRLPRRFLVRLCLSLWFRLCLALRCFPLLWLRLPLVSLLRLLLGTMYSSPPPLPHSMCPQGTLGLLAPRPALRKLGLALWSRLTVLCAWTTSLAPSRIFRGATLVGSSGISVSPSPRLQPILTRRCSSLAFG